MRLAKADAGGPRTAGAAALEGLLLEQVAFLTSSSRF